MSLSTTLARLQPSRGDIDEADTAFELHLVKSVEKESAADLTYVYEGAIIQGFIIGIEERPGVPGMRFSWGRLSATMEVLDTLAKRRGTGDLDSKRPRSMRASGRYDSSAPLLVVSDILTPLGETAIEAVDPSVLTRLEAVKAERPGATAVIYRFALDSRNISPKHLNQRLRLVVTLVPAAVSLESCRATDSNIRLLGRGLKGMMARPDDGPINVFATPVISPKAEDAGLAKVLGASLIVTNPLRVHTETVRCGNKTLISVHVENVDSGLVIQLNREVTFDIPGTTRAQHRSREGSLSPTHALAVDSFDAFVSVPAASYANHRIVFEDYLEAKIIAVGDLPVALRPRETYSFTVALSPRPGCRASELPSGSFTTPLSLSWGPASGPACCFSLLQGIDWSNPLPSSEIEVTVRVAGPAAALEPFAVIIGVLNASSSERNFTVEAVAPKESERDTLVCIESCVELGCLAPGGEVCVELQFIALRPGIHKLQGLEVIDSKTKQRLRLPAWPEVMRVTVD